MVVQHLFFKCSSGMIHMNSSLSPVSNFLRWRTKTHAWWGSVRCFGPKFSRLTATTSNPARPGWIDGLYPLRIPQPPHYRFGAAPANPAHLITWATLNHHQPVSCNTTLPIHQPPIHCPLSTPSLPRRSAPASRCFPVHPSAGPRSVLPRASPSTRSSAEDWLLQLQAPSNINPARPLVSRLRAEIWPAQRLRLHWFPRPAPAISPSLDSPRVSKTSLSGYAIAIVHLPIAQLAASVCIMELR